MSNGRFVTFEGVEGCGKTTQWRLASDRLRQLGHQVCATREPGGTELGGQLRRLLLQPQRQPPTPETELLLYCADRAEHTARVIAPALAAGQWVLCDRYSDATLAYQGHARGLGFELVERVNLGHLEPRLTLLFELPVEQALERARQRNRSQQLESESRFEAEALEFHRRVAEGYRLVAARHPQRFRVLAADRPPEQLAAQVLEELLALTVLP